MAGRQAKEEQAELKPSALWQCRYPQITWSATIYGLHLSLLGD